MLSGLGLSEIMIILLVTLVVIGPEKIPDVARMLGKGLREVRRASNMFRDMFMLEESADYKKHDRRDDLDGHGPDDDHGGLGGSISRQHPRLARQSRPVLLDPPRRATHVSEVAIADAGEADACKFELLSAPLNQRDLDQQDLVA
jgi:TatA/E family protein of Tat protein translocase